MVNVFFLGYHCRQWFFNGFDKDGPSPLNVFGGVQPLKPMVFRWFSKFWGQWSTMVYFTLCGLFLAPFGPFLTLFEKNTISSPCEWILFGSKWLTLRFEETIANFQWFLRRSSPLNVFGRSDHCHQCFYDGFFLLLPSLSMVFDGFGPLVERCDGFDGSLWSRSSARFKYHYHPLL